MNGLGSGGSVFGQQQNTQQGSGLFGSQSQTPTGGGFGLNAKRTQSFTGPTSSGPGLFGSNNSASSNNTGGLFGQNQAAKPPAANTGGGLFGSTAPATGTGGGMFGSANNSTGGGGLFGGNNAASNTQTTGGGLFGANKNSGTNSTGSGLFGGQSSGQPANSSTAPQGSLFGQSSTNSTSGGLFGSQNQSNTGATAGTNTGSGLFGGASNSGTSSLFNKSGTGTAGAAPGFGTGTGSGSGLFGGSSFGQQPSQQQSQQQPQQQPLIASMEQASYNLPGVAPSQKLYTSLSVQGTKRSAHDAQIYGYGSSGAAAQKGYASLQFKQWGGSSGSRDSFKSGVPSRDLVSIAGPLSMSSGLNAPSHIPSSTESHVEPRTWINSYDKFVRERPTTLIIKPTGRKTPPALLPARDRAPVATAPPSITAAPGNVSISMSPSKESTDKEELAAMDPAGAPADADISLFHRQANNMTLVRVNKRAIEEGYYIHPRLEDLASMSKSQLASVENLVIGRENYGQIEYPNKVDLSRIGNLGDILGSLVIFGPGTVCVYPDEQSKKAPGRELNLPSTVTIENAWPRDAASHEIIKEMEDPRMIKHIQRLRRACESRGGEFVTFTQGIWVFKVPHFSTWGLPAEEMVVDYDDGDAELADRVSNSAKGVNKLSSEARNALSSESREALVKEGADFFSDQEDATSPHNWLDQLTHASNGVLLAAAESLEAASKPTANLDLEDILSPAWKKKKTSESKGSSKKDVSDEISSESLVSFEAKASALRSSTLRQYIVRQSRPDSNLPLLKTDLSFSDLPRFSKNNHSLWKLLSVLMDDKQADRRGADVDITKLSAWFDGKVNSEDVNFQGDALDTIWQLLCAHKVKEAFNRAVTSSNPHLALLISLISERPVKGDTSAQDPAFDAEHQLEDWKTTRASSSIPKTVRRVWDLAAKRIPNGAGITWSQWLGINFWYFGDAPVQSTIAALPTSYTAGVKDSTLAFLQFYASTKQLRTAVSELNLVDSFLCLQATLKNNPSAVHADSKLYDSTCVKLAEAFDQCNDPSTAVYAALHITDSKLATRTARNILQNAPVTVSLPLDYGVPEQFLDESRAYQVGQSGEYVAQAEYLIRAGLYGDGHKIIVSTVGPEAVLKNRIDGIVSLLRKLEQNKDQFNGWKTGGHVYLMYALARSGEQNTYSVMDLCNSCRYVDTPSLKSKEAVSRIAEWVASTPFAKSNIPSQMILNMKFDPSHARVQSLQEAARLLC